jgi:hypothetical protein
VSAAKSVNIGCVRMSERHLNQQPPTSAQIQSAIIDIDIFCRSCKLFANPSHGLLEGNRFTKWYASNALTMCKLLCNIKWHYTSLTLLSDFF